ncbi:hypothetical protein DFR58_101194 [Anaerobacterium chartisolvens]|uniref:Uncharacterized protein n=1 Tax=Anaerobacterium chartisolvens TaxID=1297424 RepID=A0A369BHF7_9FIRM|nr:hypothetical protein [Anaerobacterium chartisolvens]RCX20990.1 hypothetical protein DFR58_101194 [Anaerobacterium chartisolvens]
MDLEQFFKGKRIETIVSTKSFMIALVVIGTVFYILVQNYLDSSSANNISISTAYKIFLDIVRLFSGTFISTGLISLFLRITSMKKNTEDTVIQTYTNLSKSILTAGFDLSTYSNSILEKLQERIIIQKSGLKITSDLLNDSIYSLEKNLNRLLVGLYYDYHKCTYWITPDSQNGIFKKRVNLKYNIINNYELENVIRLKLAFLNEGKKTDEEKKKNLKIYKFEINNVDLLHEIPGLLKVEDITDKYHTVYDYRITLERKLQEGKSHIIDIDYEYEVPITDSLQIYKILLPCKKFEHKIFIDGRDICSWDLCVNGFASLFYSGSELGNNFKVIEHTSHSAEITFDNWILPGAGYVVSLKNYLK